MGVHQVLIDSVKLRMFTTSFSWFLSCDIVPHFIKQREPPQSRRCATCIIARFSQPPDLVGQSSPWLWRSAHNERAKIVSLRWRWCIGDEIFTTPPRTLLTKAARIHPKASAALLWSHGSLAQANSERRSRCGP